MRKPGCRCSGHCCEAFVLNGYDRERIQRCYDNEIRFWLGSQFDCWTHPEGWEPQLVEGIFDWWPWMVYLGRFDSHPKTKAENNSKGGRDYFTCTQLGPNGDCLSYLNRPHFCKSYGVTVNCEHDGCTWDAAVMRRATK